MTLLWLLTGAAFLIAVAALARTRRVSKRLERLSESYWELRYEHGQLRSRVARLEPAQPVPGGQVPAQPVPGGQVPAQPASGGDDPAQPAATAFVPLSSLKRSNETTLAK